MAFAKRATSLAVGLALAAASGSALSAYASSIVDSSPLANGLAAEVLGAPNGLGPAFDQVNSTTPGFVTVSFDLPFADVAGSDVFVHVLEWPESEAETFEVFASLDGTASSFVSIGASGTPTGGNVVLGFDLASAGLSAARFVRVQNGRIDLAAQWEGPEIDAIRSEQSIRSVSEPTALFTVSLGLLAVGAARRARSRYAL